MAIWEISSCFPPRSFYSVTCGSSLFPLIKDSSLIALSFHQWLTLIACLCMSTVFSPIILPNKPRSRSLPCSSKRYSSPMRCLRIIHLGHSLVNLPLRKICTTYMCRHQPKIVLSHSNHHLLRLHPPRLPLPQLTLKSWTSLIRSRAFCLNTYKSK